MHVKYVESKHISYNFRNFSYKNLLFSFRFLLVECTLDLRARTNANKQFTSVIFLHREKSNLNLINIYLDTAN